MSIKITVRPHHPFRGIDDRWCVPCPSKGVTLVDQRDYGWFCGACGCRVEKPNG